jgi:hypothetical protein
VDSALLWLLLVLLLLFYGPLLDLGIFFKILYTFGDCLCGLVIRVLGCYRRCPGFDSRHYKIFFVAVGLKRGPLSFVRINEELLERKIRDPGLKN